MIIAETPIIHLTVEQSSARLQQNPTQVGTVPHGGAKPTQAIPIQLNPHHALVTLGTFIDEEKIFDDLLSFFTLV